MQDERGRSAARSGKVLSGEQTAYMETVKAAINAELKKRNLTVNALYRQLTDTYPLGLNQGTLRKALAPAAPSGDGENSSMNFFCLMAAYDYLGLDLNLLRPPRRAEAEAPAQELVPAPEPAAEEPPSEAALFPSMEVFRDAYYMGTHRVFAYLPSRSGENELFALGELSFEQREGADPVATLLLQRDPSTPGYPREGRFYRGVARLCRNDGTVFIPLADQTGTNMFLYFAYQHFRSSVLCRCALLFLNSTASRVPMVQRVLITAPTGIAAPGAEDWDVIKGALRMAEDKLFISLRSLSRLMEDFAQESWMPVFRGFVTRKLGENWQEKRLEGIKLCCVFSQNELLLLGSGTTDQELGVVERMRMLYLLLSRSEMPEQVSARTATLIHRLFMER